MKKKMVSLLEGLQALEKEDKVTLAYVNEALCHVQQGTLSGLVGVCQTWKEKRAYPSSMEACVRQALHHASIQGGLLGKAFLERASDRVETMLLAQALRQKAERARV
jgi:hypothetical protein